AVGDVISTAPVLVITRGRRGLGGEPGGVNSEAFAAAVGAEMEGPTVEGSRRRCVRGLDLHAAHRVDGVAVATAEAVAVAMQPVQNREDPEKHDVEAGGIVRLEVCDDDRPLEGSGHQSERRRYPHGD